MSLFTLVRTAVLAYIGTAQSMDGSAYCKGICNIKNAQDKKVGSFFLEQNIAAVTARKIEETMSKANLESEAESFKISLIESDPFTMPE